MMRAALGDERDRRLAQKLELIARDCDDVTDDEIVSAAEARAWRHVARAIRGVIREIAT